MKIQHYSLFFVPMPLDVYPDDEPPVMPVERCVVEADLELSRAKNVRQTRSSCVEDQP